ncbi:MAG TPA: VWA domain-containing protein [Cellvibrio sp.]|nr:VWA domain-containing protein [Cellvibrio sp.]
MKKLSLQYQLLKKMAVLVLASLPLLFTADSWATHAATANGEIEGRPAPVFRRVCLAGTSAGNYCKQNSECPGSSCATRNVFNITVAIRFNASAAQLTSIQTLISAMSAVLFDVTDGQAEIGTATLHNDAISTAKADLVIHPSTNDTWWQANSGHYRTGGFAEVSINYISNPANQGAVLAHEFSHLVFDARDEYESRVAGCGALNGGANCPVPASGQGTGLMDGNGTELCWGQGNPADLTDLSNGNHDPSNVTEHSVCRSNRSVWDQLVWAWPSTFLKPAGAPDPAANGATVNPTNFIVTSDNVRVVLVLDESGSMTAESPSRIERLKVAAGDFITTAENNTEVGIVSFSDDAATANGHAGVSVTALGNNRATWNNAINNLSPNGWTNIGDGLQKAKDMIVAAGGVTANTYIVLMTDGLNNRPSPQASADADLQAKIDDLLASGIPVYVTCTGGDLGLQSQCAEIATGTNGFNSDSAQAAKLPETFVDFHERITGHQAINSVYGNFERMSALNPITIYVDEGSRSASFALLWDNAKARARAVLTDPDGTTYQLRSIPQGLYARIANPKTGDWKLNIDPSGSNSNFVVRGYTHNRVNNFNAYLRKTSVLPSEEIYIYAVPNSFGGAITKEGEKILAEVRLPDGSTQTVELKDEGRDTAEHGDDMAKDGVFTGVFSNTTQKGAYGFQIKANIEKWQLGEDGHVRNETLRSPKFLREIRLSAGVSDPKDVETTPEDDPKGGSDRPDPQKLIIWLLYLTIVLLIIIFIVMLSCCHCKKNQRPVGTVSRQ